MQDHQHEPTSTESMEHGDSLLNLKQVARILDVHYMTAYRYVRHGRLAAELIGGIWMVQPEDLQAFVASPAPDGDVQWSARLAEHLGTGDDVAAWAVIRDAANSGRSFEDLHLEVLTGAMARLVPSTDPASAVEHRIAIANASRLVARLGGRVTHRGRKLGTVLLCSPVGEHHGLGLAIVANLIRQAGFRVLELGTDAPAEEVCIALDRVDDPVAVGVGVTTAGVLAETRHLVIALHQTHPEVPVLLGGQGVLNPEVAEALGAQAWSTASDLVDTLRDLATQKSVQRRKTARKKAATPR